MKSTVIKILNVCLSMILCVSFSFAEPGVTDTEILLGSSTPLEGTISYLGNQTNHGLRACLEAINAKGGVNGRKIKLNFYNDDYDPITCVKVTKKLIEEDKVFALTCYVGTPTSIKTMPMWVNAKVPALGFFTGAEGLRVPFNRYTIHVRGSYFKEAEAMVDLAVNKLKLKKIAIFYQYDAFGEAVKKGAELALEKNKITPLLYGSYERSSTDVSEAVKKMAEAKPDAIIMGGVYAPSVKFILEAKKAGLTKTVFITGSFVGPDELAKGLQNNDENVYVSQAMPLPSSDAKEPVVAEYLKAIKQYFPNDTPNTVSLEGYVDGKILVEGLKRAGKNLTREGFIDAIESIKDGKEIGIDVEYSKNNHQGMNMVYVTKLVNGKYQHVK